MRSNVFLHFLNRDTREIFGLYQQQRDEDHYRLLRRSVNAAVLLCEDHCIAPPGFIVEDEIAFKLAEAQKAYLNARVLQFPIRERSLADYAEKKRVGYHPMRNRYSGLFDDTRIGFLGQHARGLIRRQTHISDNILAGWQAGAEANKRPWQPVKKILLPAEIDAISRIPSRLYDDGTALTWSAIEPLLPDGARAASRPLRDVLQHIYFRQYCAEFELIIVTQIPYMIDDFFLPKQERAYSYLRLQEFLGRFELSSRLLDAPAEFLVALRPREGFIRFMDAFVALAEKSENLVDLQFAASRTVRACTFQWEGYATRYPKMMLDVNMVEVVELDHALEEAASMLNREYGLRHRLSETGTEAARRAAVAGRAATVKEKQRIMSENESAALVLFVALDEELEVLARILGLKRPHKGPAATGKLGETVVDVICPRDMGRVPAAVSVASYLEARRERLPKLILIVGLAGGFPEEGTDQGHTICATTVVDLASRKVIDADDGQTESKFRRRDFTMSETLWTVLSSDTFDRKAWIEETTDAAEWPKDRRPSLHRGLLASVDEVISSDSWRKRLLAHTEKLKGVEMEAGGVCAAALQYRVPVCMLRVASDKADPSKADDRWRIIGMKTLGYLLRHIPFEAVLEA